MKRLSRLLCLLPVFILLGCADMNRPDLPLRYSFRDSLVGQGKVLMIRNDTDKFFQLKLEVHNRTLNAKSTHAINVGPRKTTEIGWLELDDWHLVTGERIRIHNDGYKTAHLVVP